METGGWYPSTKSHCFTSHMTRLNHIYHHVTLKSHNKELKS